MTFAHAVVWIDHQQAEVVSLSSARERTGHIMSPAPPRKLHRKSGIPGAGRAPVSHAFFDAVADALTDVRTVLIVGPGLAKVELAAHLEERRPDVFLKVAGVEAMNHPTHAELVARARTFFRRKDQLEGIEVR
jgi:NADPH-dependent 2,4-dienoyl-CoA reductase/sulfur reductase-like enzyme